MRVALRWWAPVLAIAVAGMALWLTVDWWCWLVKGEHESPSATIRNIVLVAAAPVALILALWRSMLLQDQTEIARHGLREERYRNAAEMLGSDKLAVRLGGIHTLSELASQHPKEFHRRVVQLFAAFVRHPPVDIPQERPGVTDGGFPVPDIPREDVQTIMVFFGERSDAGRKIENNEDIIIDLQRSDLRGIWLGPDACLTRVRLTGANLAGAKLSGVRGLTSEAIFGIETDSETILPG